MIIVVLNTTAAVSTSLDITEFDMVSVFLHLYSAPTGSAGVVTVHRGSCRWADWHRCYLIIAVSWRAFSSRRLNTETDRDVLLLDPAVAMGFCCFGEVQQYAKCPKTCVLWWVNATVVIFSVRLADFLSFLTTEHFLVVWPLV